MLWLRVYSRQSVVGEAENLHMFNVSQANHAGTVAFGPEAPDWGSWDWVGADLARALDETFSVRTFQPWEIPECEVVVTVKHQPPMEWVDQVTRRARLIYAPVDGYGSAAEIDQDASWLRRCFRVVIHCERLRKYFQPYASVEFMDHHVKFVAPTREEYHPEGTLLWIGVRSNLGPLVKWVNKNPLPAPLDVVTNFEDPAKPPTAREIGFGSEHDVRVHNWSAGRHVEMTANARAVIDIKGDDFRARHKPPAKAIDFIASGVPLAMNAGTSPVAHLARMGFEVASPMDTGKWLSREYWEETRRFGLVLRELLSLERVARRWKRVLQDVCGNREELATDKCT
jgi:hypothetical protein